MAAPIKYQVAQEGDGVLLRLREDYERAVLPPFAKFTVSGRLLSKGISAD